MCRKPWPGPDSAPAAADRNVFLLPGGFHFGAAGTRIRTVLGSCVAIALWHPQRRIGGMCHYVLPGPGPDVEGGRDGRYAEDAVLLFLDEIRRAGTAPGDYHVKLLGGGCMFPSRLGVGGRNIEAARRLLGQHGFGIHREHLAGDGHRHVVFDLASGIIWLRHVKHSRPA